MNRVLICILSVILLAGCTTRTNTIGACSAPPAPLDSAAIAGLNGAHYAFRDDIHMPAAYAPCGTIHYLTIDNFQIDGDRVALTVYSGNECSTGGGAGFRTGTPSYLSIQDGTFYNQPFSSNQCFQDFNTGDCGQLCTIASDGLYCVTVANGRPVTGSNGGCQKFARQ